MRAALEQGDIARFSSLWKSATLEEIDSQKDGQGKSLLHQVALNGGASSVKGEALEPQ